MRGLSNKIVTTAIMAAMAAQNTAAFAKAPADVEGTRFEEPIQVLAALGIMIGDENGEFRPDDTIIRSEVTKMAIHAMGLESAAKSSEGVTKFPDVAKDHWANGYINLATSLGLIIGDEHGNFRPNEYITYAEAMTIMVRVLGYEPSAQKKGGYPSGYIMVGSENGLSDNVQGGMYEAITRGNVAYVTYNSLDVNMMEQVSFGQTPQYEVVEKTLLKDKLGVTKKEGQVVAIPNSAIDGESKLADGQVKIGDHVYETEYNMSNLLGHNVTYYVEDEGKASEKIILAMPIAGKNTTLNIKADMFEKITTKNGKKMIEYFETESSSKTKTAEILSTAKLIYNGKHTENSDELIDIKNSSGSVYLLDTDKDGVYDIIFVTEYTNMVVDTVSQAGRITDKYDAPSILLDEDTVDFTINKGYEKIKTSDLREYDVLSVAVSLDKKLYTIEVSNETVTGKVTGSSDDKFFIDGEGFKVAANYKKPITIGMEATFYLDIEGKIAAVDTAQALSTNYGYLMKAYKTDDEVVKAKFFTKEGKEVVITLADKIRFNGTSGKRPSDILSEIKAGEKTLVTYTENSDGKLTELELATDNSATGKPNTSKFTLDNKLTEAIFNEAKGTLGNVTISDKTLIFNIPAGSEDVSEYSVADISMFEDDESYDAFVYDLTEDYVAKVIIVTNASFKANASSPIAVVDKVFEGTNEDGEITDVLSGVSEGKEIELYAKEKGILVNGESALKTGDIIQYKANPDGEITEIRVLMSISDKDTEKTTKPAENLETVYGKVVRKFASSINVTVNDGEVVNYKLPEDINVYSVDTTLSKNQVSVAEASDIQNFDAEEGNRVFIKLYKDVVSEIVIIK